MSISWIAVSTIAPSRRSFHRGEVAADRVVRRDVGDVVWGDLKLVQVRLQAVAAGDPRNRLVAGVHDDVFTLAKAQIEHASPPPRQVAPSFVCLLVQVLRGFPWRQPVEPHEPALRRVDQRPVLTRTGAVGREDVTRRGVAIGHADVEHRRLDARQGVEALVVGGRRCGIVELRDGCRRIWRIDAKAEGDLLAGTRADHGAHTHALAGVERLLGHEAGAVALEVTVYVALVMAGFGADDRHFADIRGGRAEEADLRVGVGGVGSRLGRDVDVGTGETGAVRKRRGQARRARWACVSLCAQRRCRGWASRSRSQPRSIRGPRPEGRCIRSVSCVRSPRLSGARQYRGTPRQPRSDARRAGHP